MELNNRQIQTIKKYLDNLVRKNILTQEQADAYWLNSASRPDRLIDILDGYMPSSNREKRAKVKPGDNWRKQATLPKPKREVTQRVTERRPRKDKGVGRPEVRQTYNDYGRNRPTDQWVLLGHGTYQYISDKLGIPINTIRQQFFTNGTFPDTIVFHHICLPFFQNNFDVPHV